MGIFSFFKKNKKDKSNVEPEAKWKVEFIGTTIRAIDCNGIESSIEVDGIHQTIVETNDTGPWGTDLWWRILPKNGILSVPGGVTGEPKMLENFQGFSNFNNEQLIKAMRSVDNAEFIVWQNKP